MCISQEKYTAKISDGLKINLNEIMIEKCNIKYEGAPSEESKNPFLIYIS